MTRKCTWCGDRTSASSGRCQSCKSKLHHALKRIKKEGLIVDTVLGDETQNDRERSGKVSRERSWWVWDKKGDVLVMGQPTRGDAMRALALGDTTEHEYESKSAAQLQREIDEELG